MTREEVLNIVGICVCMARVDLEFSQDEKHLLQELCKNINVSDKEKAQIKNISGSLSEICLLYTSPSPRDRQKSRMPSSA